MKEELVSSYILSGGKRNGLIIDIYESYSEYKDQYYYHLKVGGSILCTYYSINALFDGIQTSLIDHLGGELVVNVGGL